MRFRSVVELGGKTATGIEVPEEVVAALGSHKRPPVRVTIGEYTYRSTVGAMGGKTLISLPKAHRDAAGLAAGDHVTVTLTLEEGQREVEVPAALAAALSAAGLAETDENRDGARHSGSYAPLRARGVDGRSGRETDQEKPDE